MEFGINELSIVSFILAVILYTILYFKIKKK